MSEAVVFFSIGNPGAINRHSTGHFMLQKLMDHYEAGPLTKKGKFSVSKLGDGSVVFVKSNAYMNESGKALKEFVQSERLADAILIILYDDFENNIGKIRIGNFKKNESHNGIKSIQQFVQSTRYTVFKLGIGIGPKPANATRDTMSSWVLSAYRMEEKEQLSTTAFDLLTMYIDEVLEQDGVVEDINKFNTHMTKMYKNRAF